MKKHLIVFLCYELYDIHKKSYENLKVLDADFFIVENPSQNTPKIETIFTNEAKVIKYIRFKVNTTNFGAALIKNYYDFLMQYEYVTITDGDLLYDDPHATKEEVVKNLQYKDVVISAVDMKLDNLPNVPGADKWIHNGTLNTEFQYNECATGGHFLTLLRENLYLLQNVKIIDSIIHDKITKLGKKWVKTVQNKAYHLTWDLYYPGNPYYEFKKTFTWCVNEDQQDYDVII